MSKLNREVHTPLYLQIEDLIIEQVESGEISPGDTIPSEAELQKKYNVSRTTIRQAMANLAKDGIIIKKQGKGTFVSKVQKTEPNLSNLCSFSEEIMKDGGKPGSKVLELGIIGAPKHIADIFKIKKGNPVIIYERLRSIDDALVGLHTVYLNQNVLPFFDLNKLNQDNISLYQFLEKDLKIHIYVADETLKAISADENIAKILNIPIGTPIMLLKRTTYTLGGQPFEYAKIIVKGEEFQYKARLTRKNNYLKNPNES